MPTPDGFTGEPVSANVPLAAPPAEGVGVGVVVAVGAVPVNVIVPEVWSLTVKLVVAVCVPAVCGTNVYVNTHDALGANVAPAQVCTELKLGSPGAPPVTINVCGVDDRFVTTTS
jgi:hypothetical protein